MFVRIGKLSIPHNRYYSTAKNILQLTVAFSNVHANKVSTGNKAMGTLGDTPVVNTEDLDNKKVMSFNPELTLGSTQDTKLHIDQQKC